MDCHRGDSHRYYNLQHCLLLRDKINKRVNLELLGNSKSFKGKLFIIVLSLIDYSIFYCFVTDYSIFYCFVTDNSIFYCFVTDNSIFYCYVTAYSIFLGFLVCLLYVYVVPQYLINKKSST